MGRLAQVLLRLNRQQEIRRLSLQEREGGLKSFEQQSAAGFDLSRQVAQDRYLDRLTAQALEAEREIEALQPELRQEQEKVIEARRRRRLLEILKEREKERYDQRIYKIEKKELEELNSKRNHNRREKL